MKTIIATFLVVGLLSTAASAWSDLPGYGYGNGHGNWQSYGEHQPSFAKAQEQAVVPSAPQPPHIEIAQAANLERGPEARK